MKKVIGILILIVWACALVYMVFPAKETIIVLSVIISFFGSFVFAVLLISENSDQS